MTPTPLRPDAPAVNADAVQAERQAFLLRLTDVLRGSGSTQQILSGASEMLGRHFVVNRVGYGHVDENVDLIDYDVCWTDGTVPPLLGQFPASAFGQQVIDRLLAGETIVIANVREHPLTSDQAAQKTSHEVDTRAILVVPLFKAGRLRTIVYLNQTLARAWTPHEVDLMQEVAERTRELIERGRAEDALRASEARWRGLFERMGEGFFVAEAIRDGEGRMVDFRFLEVNPAFERLTGIPPAEATGRRVTEAVPGVPTELIETYARVVDTGEPAEFEVHLPTLQDRWYEARARRVGPEQFSVLFVEITERKATQQALVESKDRYRTLFESIDEGFCVLEVLVDDAGRPVDYRFLEINPAFERQAGLKDPLGRTIRELLPGIESTYVETYGRVALTGQAIRFESRADALGRWFDAFAFRLEPAHQRRVALLFTDITERKRAEQALREREHQLREAQELALIGSWSWDLRTGDLVASAQLFRIFGLPAGEPLPAFPDQRDVMYPAGDWERLEACVQTAQSTGSSYAIDVRALRLGEPIWVTARGIAVYGADGQVVGLRGTVQDITERKQAEEALRLADVRKDEFLATLAHELRNPLAPIGNGLAILRRAEPGSPAGVRAREVMERQVAHLVHLVDDLLDVSRVSQGKVTLKKSVVPLRSLVDSAVETSTPLVEAGHHRLTLSLPDEPVMLRADPTRIAQVLSNVLNNAAKYTPAGGEIRLQAALLPEARVAIKVTDTGIGIPPAMLENVFELFTQLDVAQGVRSGLGIGLALARRLLELHGGSIRAYSAGEGRGSSFVIELPLAVDDAPEAALAPTAVPAGAQRRVLLVDDNVDAAESLALLLQLEGHAVLVGHTAAEGLAAAIAHQPDLLLLDIGLPDMNGYELARRVRQSPGLEHVTLVALTGWGAARDQQQAREAGFDLHLTKPVSPDQLARALALRRT